MKDRKTKRPKQPEVYHHVRRERVALTDKGPIPRPRPGASVGEGPRSAIATSGVKVGD
jgi:hypothetical protein